MFGLGITPRCLALGRGKKKAARKGRLRFGRWLRLEEDHATNLEEIETVKAGVEALAEVLVDDCSPVVIDHSETSIGRIQVEVEMLPAGKEMHRRRVDLLYDTEAPPLDFRTGHLCAGQIGIAVRESADRQAGGAYSPAWSDPPDMPGVPGMRRGR